MIKFLEAILKGVLSLFITLLVIVCLTVIVLLYTFSGWLALGFLVFLVVYVLVDELFKKFKKHREASPDK